MKKKEQQDIAQRVYDLLNDTLLGLTARMKDIFNQTIGEGDFVNLKECLIENLDTVIEDLEDTHKACEIYFNYLLQDKSFPKEIPKSDVKLNKPIPKPKPEPKEEDNSIEVKIIEKEQQPPRQPLNFGGIKITQEQLDMASKMASKILPEVLKSFNMETDEIEIKIDTIDTMVKRAMEEQKPEIDIGEWKMEEDNDSEDKS